MSCGSKATPCRGQGPLDERSYKGITDDWCTLCMMDTLITPIEGKEKVPCVQLVDPIDSSYGVGICAGCLPRLRLLLVESQKEG